MAKPQRKPKIKQTTLGIITLATFLLAMTLLALTGKGHKINEYGLTTPSAKLEKTKTCKQLLNDPKLALKAKSECS